MDNRQTSKRLIYWIPQILIPVLIFGLILSFRSIPVIFRPASLAFRYGATTAIGMVGIGSFLVFLVKGKTGNVLLVTWIMALYAFALNGQWASGLSDGWAAGGLLPWAEAGSYYVESMRLIQGWDISSSAARRPLYPVYLSILMRFTHGNLMAVLAIEAAILGLTTFILIQELRKRFGPAPSALALVLLFMLSRRFTGVTGTESLGYPLSMLGFALLLRNARLNYAPGSRLELFVGLGMLALAQFVRPAALFMLPMIGLWIGLQYRGSRKISVPMTGIAAVLILAALGVNAGVFSTFAAPGSMMNDSWSWSVYGVATGGKGFYQHDIDFPECKTISAAACSDLVMQGAVNEIIHHPENLIKGIVKTYSALVSNTYNNLFSFATFSFADARRTTQEQMIELVLFGLYFVGLAVSLTRLREPLDRLILMATVGIFLSVPFAPPTESNRMRLYTVSILMTILPVSIGLETLLRLFFHWKLVRRIRSYSHWFLDPQASAVSAASPSGRFSVLGWVSVGFLLYTFIVPYGLNLAAKIHPAPQPRADCPSDLSPAVIDYSAGAALQIDPEPLIFLDWVPRLHESRFDKGLHASGSQWALTQLYELETPVVLIETLDLLKGNTIWIASPPDLLAGGNGRLSICGRTGDPEGFNFLYPETVTWIDD